MTKEQMLELFANLSPEERGSVYGELPNVGLPADYDGFFVPTWCNDVGEKRRDAIKYEMDGLINAQSLGFTIDIIPRMLPFLERLEGQNRYLEALDVGSRTGAGPGLLADLFMAHFSHLPTYFDTIDIDPTFRDYQLSRWPRLRSVLTGNVFDLQEGSYDYVLCSHTIEHIAEPRGFIEQLCKISKGLTFFYCPFEETNPIIGHYTVTEKFIRSLDPLDIQVFDSWWWRPQGKPAPVVFFVVDRK